MRRYIALACLIVAVLLTGCSSTEKPAGSGSGDRGSSGSGAGGY